MKTRREWMMMNDSVISPKQLFFEDIEIAPEVLWEWFKFLVKKNI